MRDGRPVALVTRLDEDDWEWFAREREPEFIASIRRARAQIARGETLSDSELDLAFADVLDGLDLTGFSAITSIEILQRTRCSFVPPLPGVYVVLRPSRKRPVFLERSGAGWFQGKDPSYESSIVFKKWVAPATVLYVGKGDGQGGLQRRLREFVDFGYGKAVGHRGGRLVWHLKDYRSLQVRWMPTPDRNPRDVKNRLIKVFS